MMSIDHQDHHGVTLLMRAVEKNKVWDVKSLLCNGANPNIRDNMGLTAFYWASLDANTDIMELLAQAGADVNIQSDNGSTALMSIMWELNVELVEPLLRLGVKPNLQNKNGNTILFYLLGNNYGDDKIKRNKILKLLLEYGADPTVINFEGKTVYDYADDEATSILLDFANNSYTITPRS